MSSYRTTTSIASRVSLVLSVLSCDDDDAASANAHTGNFSFPVSYLVAGECQNLKALRLVLLVQAVYAHIQTTTYSTWDIHKHDVVCTRRQIVATK